MKKKFKFNLKKAQLGLNNMSADQVKAHLDNMRASLINNGQKPKTPRIFTQDGAFATTNDEAADQTKDVLDGSPSNNPNYNGQTAYNNPVAPNGKGAPQNKPVGFFDQPLQLNWNHILGSYAATGLAGFLSNKHANSYENATLRYNASVPPTSWMPENPNTSLQGFYGGNMQKGGEIKSYNPNLANNDAKFQAWYKKNTLEGQRGIPFSNKLDYDYYSFFMNGMSANPNFNPTNHFPDTFKRPNHKTFSNESIYSTPENPGGYWTGEQYHPNGKFQMQQGGQILGPINFTNSYFQSEQFKKRAGSNYENANELFNNYHKKYNPVVTTNATSTGAPDWQDIFATRGIGGKKNVVINPNEAKELNTSLYSGVLPHEYAHTLRKLSREEEEQIVNLQNNDKVKQVYDKYKNTPSLKNSYSFSEFLQRANNSNHDYQPNEQYSDLNALRYLMYKNGIYDARQGDLTPEQWKKAKEKLKDDGIFKRAIQHFNDEDFIKFNNSIAGSESTDNVNIAQKGGSHAPIITHNPNDPRLKAYNDSLDAYNDTKYFVDEIKNHPGWFLGAAVPKKTASLYYKYVNAHPNIKPVAGVNYKFSDGDIDSNFPVYKKPVQPVIYQKEEPKLNRMNAPLPTGNDVARTNIPTRAMNPIDVRNQPSDYSITFGDGDDQQTVYLPSLDVFKAVTDANGYEHRDIQADGKRAQATAYKRLQKGGTPKQTNAIENNRKYADGPILNWLNSFDWNGKEEAEIQKQYDFLNNWYKNRKQVAADDAVDGNMIYKGQHNIPQTTLNEMPDIRKGKPEKNLLTYGAYQPSTNRIRIQGVLDQPKNPMYTSAYIHEYNHAWQNQMNPDFHKDNVAEPTQRAFANFGNKYTPEQMMYLRNPDEVQSRIMQFRYLNNLDPKKHYNVEDVKKMKFKNNLMLNMYDDYQMTELLNNLVSNGKHSSMPSAQRGGQVYPQGNGDMKGYFPTVTAQEVQKQKDNKDKKAADLQARNTTTVSSQKQMSTYERAKQEEKRRLDWENAGYNTDAAGHPTGQKFLYKAGDKVAPVEKVGKGLLDMSLLMDGAMLAKGAGKMIAKDVAKAASESIPDIGKVYAGNNKGFATGYAWKNGVPVNNVTGKTAQEEYVENLKNYYNSEGFHHRMDTYYPEVDKQSYINKTLQNLENPITYSDEPSKLNASGMYLPKNSNDVVYTPNHVPTFKQKVKYANTTTDTPYIKPNGTVAGNSYVKHLSSVDHELSHQRTNADELLPEYLTQDYLMHNVKPELTAKELGEGPYGVKEYYSDPTEFEVRMRQLREDIKKAGIKDYFNKGEFHPSDVEALIAKDKEHTPAFLEHQKAYRDWKDGKISGNEYNMAKKKYDNTVEAPVINMDSEDLIKYWNPKFLAEQMNKLPVALPVAGAVGAAAMSKKQKGGPISWEDIDFLFGDDNTQVAKSEPKTNKSSSDKVTTSDVDQAVQQFDNGEDPEELNAENAPALFQTQAWSDPEFKRGGLVNNTGYLPGSPTANNPINIIPSQHITMATVPHNVLAIPAKGRKLGKPVVMQPNSDYVFDADHTVEFALGGEYDLSPEHIAYLKKLGYDIEEI